ncbi:MAG: MarR family transcriptional regulator [Cellvibrionales bacterium]
MAEWRIMAVLGEYRDISAGQVSNKTQIEKSILSRAINELLQRQLLLREFDAAGRRRSMLRLTATGLSRGGACVVRLPRGIVKLL